MSKKFNESLRNSISEKAAKSLRNQVAVANSRDYNMHMNAYVTLFPDLIVI